MSLFKRLFGGGGGDGPAQTPPETYKGFDIYVEPARESGGFRVAARIEKDVGGVRKRHEMVRADVIQTRDEAASVTLTKAKMLIDEQGERIFLARDGD